MNPMTVGLGALIVAYGCYTAYARVGIAMIVAGMNGLSIIDVMKS